MTAPAIDSPIPVAVLGGTGFVAGELLRLLLGHPRFELVAAVSSSQVGAPVVSAFPHLAGTSLDGVTFESPEAVVARFQAGQPFGLLAATPHGATAALLDPLLTAAERAGAALHAVDLSADFRFQDTLRYQAIYGHPHGAPARAPAFTCAVPEQVTGCPTPHAAQPGCFATAVTLGAHALFKLGLVEGSLFASAVTGSSGSGRSLSEGTHHPLRRSNLFAYSPLAHRHEPEVCMLLGLARGGEEPEVELVPHSGPFVRGIHATLRLTLREAMPAERLVAAVNEVYSVTPFVRASLEPPRLTEVVGTNRCRLGLAVRGRTLVVTSVIDNLIKGAAGGGLQWLNRLFELPDETGLRLGGLGWH